MIKLAFISDIHSNLPALESTLKDIKERGINRIYCLGDIIGYHSYTNEVISLLKENHVVSIKGNHDDMITRECFDRSNPKDFVLYWNFDKLTEDNLLYLKHLPDSLEFKVEETSISLVHGSPNSITEYIKENSAEATLYIEEMKSDVLICAHTHIPYITSTSGKHLLNTGSIGKPKFGKPECSYIILNIDGKKISPEIISIPYDVDEIVNHLRDNKFPEHLITALETGNP